MLKKLTFTASWLKGTVIVGVICSVKFELFARRLGLQLSSGWGMIAINNASTAVAVEDLDQGHFSAELMYGFMTSFENVC